MAIDKSVKIDDSPAFAAFQVLGSHVQKLEKEAGASLNAGIRSVYVLMGITGMAILLFFIFSFLTLASVGRRFSALHKATIEIGKGNFSFPLTVTGKDEIGAVSQAIGTMAQRIQKVMQQIHEQAEDLSDSSESLSTVSLDLAENTRQASEQTNSVAAAAEEMSANMNSVAAASEEASTNVSLVSSAIEEILASVEDETRHTEKAQEITRHAVHLAASSSEKVDALGVAALEIIAENSSMVSKLAGSGESIKNTVQRLTKQISALRELTEMLQGEE